jgi:membrane-bound serine protease (ClpP class)
MTLILVLFVAGVILLTVEVVVPGAILGIAGGVALLAGVFLAFDDYGMNGGLIALATALALVAIALYLEFVLLPRSRIARTFSMTETVAGTSQPALADRAVIGKHAVAVTPLVPSGVVECEGRRFEAYARSGHARTGEQLEIVDLDNFRLIVTKSSTTQSK